MHIEPAYSLVITIMLAIKDIIIKLPAQLNLNVGLSNLVFYNFKGGGGRQFSLLIYITEFITNVVIYANFTCRPFKQYRIGSDL